MKQIEVTGQAAEGPLMRTLVVRVAVLDRTVVKVVVGLVLERSLARYVLASCEESSFVKVTVHHGAPRLTGRCVHHTLVLQLSIVQEGKEA